MRLILSALPQTRAVTSFFAVTSRLTSSARRQTSLINDVGIRWRNQLAEVERQLRDQLTALMVVSTVAEAEAIRREVLDREPYVRALDSAVPGQRAVRRLYGYIDWRSKDTVEPDLSTSAGATFRPTDVRSGSDTSV